MTMRNQTIFQIKERTSGRWQITASYEAWDYLPQNIVAAIIWRSYPTAQAAFKDASKFWFQICDAKLRLDLMENP